MAPPSCDLVSPAAPDHTHLLSLSTHPPILHSCIYFGSVNKEIMIGSCLSLPSLVSHATALQLGPLLFHPQYDLATNKTQLAATTGTQVDQGLISIC